MLEMGISKLCRMNNVRKRTEKIMMKVEADEISRFRGDM
jgi:hypothetical protein